MSVVWLQSFILNPIETNVFTFQSLNLVIYNYLYSPSPSSKTFIYSHLYLNIFSCLSFVFYSLLYNMNVSLQRPPSKHKKLNIKNH